MPLQQIGLYGCHKNNEIPEVERQIGGLSSVRGQGVCVMDGKRV